MSLKILEIAMNNYNKKKYINHQLTVLINDLQFIFKNIVSKILQLQLHFNYFADYIIVVIQSSETHS